MLSIVIPTHQRTDLLQRCLASVLRHAPAGTEVLVVDDASPSGRATTLARQFMGVKILRHEQRRGFAVSANRGIQASTAPVVQLLNDDTEVTGNWAQAALKWFADPKIGAVAPLVLKWPGDRIDSAGDRYHVGGIAAKRGRGRPLGPDFASPCTVFGASASSAFYRRTALVRVGFFPEAFGSYFEDVDLSFRLQRGGYQTMYEPAARVLHHVGASHGRADRRLLQQQSRNEERVFWRNLPARILWRALPGHLAVLAGKAWRRWQEGSLLPWACGRLELLAEVNDLRKHRASLQRLGDCDNVATWGIDTTYQAARTLVTSTSSIKA